MNKVNIQGQEYPIQKIFSDDFFFTIPLYQRPYAWTTEQAEELFDDLLIFAGDSREQIEELNPYFLGSIVLIKGEKPEALVVDGQQRLTTLTILLSTIRALVQTKFADALTPFLYQEGSLITGTSNRYRLRIRERDDEFFRQYIQDEGGIEQFERLNPAMLSDSQKNVRENALLFLRRLGMLSEERRVRLAQAIVNRCYLVVVSTPNFDSAYRIFSVLNDRGLNLSHADILKADIIGKIPSEQEQARYNENWEEMEDSLGREMFQNLFAHIRMIYRKVKLQDTVLEEFRDYVWPTREPHLAERPQEFIDTVLIPYAEAFSAIKNMNYQSVKFAEKVNDMLKWLNRMDNSDWIPPAILYFSRHSYNPDAMVHFFTDLERLAARLMIVGANVNKRIERYGRLLSAIENNDNLFAAGSPLQLSDVEQQKIIAMLDSNLYEYWFCKYVLLRLDEALSDGGASFNFPIISIEHVLPQHPKPDSTWVRWFPNQEKREEYVHRLGNLVLLSRKKNASAQNYDFVVKKQKYFTTGTGISPFPLTTQVLLEDQWTASVIERRQRMLVNRLKDIWRLN